MQASTVAPALTPWQEAEAARQVINVLARIERRFEEGRWARGHRFSPRGGNCLIGAIDEATGWVLPGVSDRVTAVLAARLPAPFRAVAQVRPRLALAAYNDTVARHDDVLRLVREAQYALGGSRQGRSIGRDRLLPWSTETQPATDTGPASPRATKVDVSQSAAARTVTTRIAPRPAAGAATGPWTARQPSQR